MLNQIQSALMNEAARMQEEAVSLGNRMVSLAYVWEGTPEGVDFRNMANGFAKTEGEIGELKYSTTIVATILDAKACVRETLRLRAVLQGVEAEVLQGEHNLQVQETSLLQELFPAY